MDLTASSAVNFPITSASLRLSVIWMGVRSIRCTYSGARVPPRFTLTTNLMFIMIVSFSLGVRNKREAASFLHICSEITTAAYLVTVHNCSSFGI